MKVVIVIPTYNEVANIGRLLSALLEEIENFPHHKFEILVVDGNSPDGTANVVSDSSAKDNRVQLLMEKKKAGLGAAYVYGFQHAIARMGAEAVVEMDSDFQHDPKDFTKLLKAFDEGYDYVLGSRYVKGGSIPKEWAFYRVMLSVVGNMASKLILGIYNVSDFTTGFKISRVKGFLDKIDLDSINSQGFAYKIDLLYKMYNLKAKIKEVPITFGVRNKGDSKMVVRGNTLDSLKVIIFLRVKNNISFFKFLAVGFTGLFVDSGIFNLLRIMLDSDVSSVISGFFGIATTFILNNHWSFVDRKINGKRKKSVGIVVYFVSSYIPIVFRSWLIGFLVNTFGNTLLISNLAFFIGILIGLVWNYTIYSKLIWKKNNA